MKNTIILICLIVFISCVKKKVPVEPTVYIKTVNLSNQIKAFGYFKVGSYWIYRDSTNTVLDSVYVTTASITTKEFQINDTLYKVETATVTFNNFLNKFTLCSWPNDNISTKQNWGYTIFEIDTSHVTSVIGDGLNINKSLSSLSVLSNTYVNVREIYFSYKFLGSGPYVWYVENNYWCKNIGIIKRRIYNAPLMTYSTYELLRHNIVQ